MNDVEEPVATNRRRSSVLKGKTIHGMARGMGRIS